MVVSSDPSLFLLFFAEGAWLRQTKPICHGSLTLSPLLFEIKGWLCETIKQGGGGGGGGHSHRHSIHSFPTGVKNFDRRISMLTA